MDQTSLPKAGHSADGNPGRRAAGLELAVVFVATVLLLSLFSASDAAHLNLWRRIVGPGKIAVLVLLASWLVWRSGGRWRDLGLRRPPKFWRTLLLILGGFVAGEMAAGLVVQFGLVPLGFKPPGVPPFLTRLHGDLPEYLYWMIPVTWGSAAFGEELLFRGFALDRLDRLMGGRAPWIAVIVQGLLFGAAHAYLGVSGAVVAGVLGLVLGGVFLLGGRNLWPCFIIHGMVDSVSMTALFLGLVPFR